MVGNKNKCSRHTLHGGEINRGFSIDLEEYAGAKHHLLPAPAVFIVSGKGQILFQYVNPDYKVRLHPEILLAAAKAYAKK
jgi:peroxiredoxin